jgi:hypothetical protein
MGGQACVFYGAAEFSRDCDIVILSDEANLNRFTAALSDLQAECIAVPEFKVEYLNRGHAVHFRCQHPDAKHIGKSSTRQTACIEGISISLPIEESTSRSLPVSLSVVSQAVGGRS